MKLEIISRLPQGPTRPVPLLFVHGSNSAAWVWDEHFLPHFAEAGYDAHAVSLRGHGRSEGFGQLGAASLRDYVEDLARTVAGIDRPPVIIGHSMGGMVIQKYLQYHDRVAGAVLMNSVPPHGLMLTSWAMAMQNPVLFQQFCLVQTMGPLHPMAHRITREVLFSDDLPEDKARRYFNSWQPESQRVVLDLLGLDLPRSNGKTPPMLVLGGAKDVIVNGMITHLTARHYGTKAKVFPDLAHAMMLETRWQEVADHMLEWLDGTFGAAELPARTRAA